MLAASGGGLPSLGDENAPWFEATIPQLQSLMESGGLTTRDLTRAYLARIGYDSAFFGSGLGPFEPGMTYVANAALGVMQSLGATIGDTSIPVGMTEDGQPIG